MLTFTLLSALVIAAIAFGGVIVVPLIVIGAVIWLISIPFRLLLKVVFAILGGLLGVLTGPVLAVAALVALVVTFVAGILGLLAPLAPFALVALLVWGVVRVVMPRPA